MAQRVCLKPNKKQNNNKNIRASKNYRPLSARLSQQVLSDIEETSHGTTCHAQIGCPSHQEASKNQLTGVVADVILPHFLYGKHVCSLQYAAPPLLHVTLLNTRRQREREKNYIENKETAPYCMCIYKHLYTVIMKKQRGIQ